MNKLTYSILAPLVLTAIAYANPTVNSPSNGSYVGSPFTLSASSGTCSSQPVSAMAYPIDSGADMDTINGQVLDTQVSVGTGQHTVHVKAWGDKGAGCMTDVSVDVTGGSSGGGGNPTVSSPSSGSTVDSPFNLSASASSCSSQPVSAMAYSIDNGGNIVTVNAQSLNAQVPVGSGAHTLHVKSWGNRGAGCATNITVNVSGSASSGGGINVNSPSNGETVNTSFTLSATASSCSSQTVAAMAYSIDNGSNIATVNSQSLDVQVNVGSGEHTLHVKSWGNQGAGCATNVAINVSGSGSSGGGSSGAYIPSNAISVSNIQTMGNWKANNDSATGGSASGWMGLVSSPAHTGTTRRTATGYSNAGGERYSVSFGDDTQAQNFVYDAWIYLENTAGSLANLEMDLNQVMPNGQTVIFGFQCDGYNKKWDYTINAGTPDQPVDKWLQSGAYCDVTSWGQYQWHHVQIEYSRDNSGNINYKNVYLDGKQSAINAWGKSAFTLGWAPTMLTNLQVDGRGSNGNIVVDVDAVTIYRW